MHDAPALAPDVIPLHDKNAEGEGYGFRVSPNLETPSLPHATPEDKIKPVGQDMSLMVTINGDPDVLHDAHPTLHDARAVLHAALPGSSRRPMYYSIATSPSKCSTPPLPELQAPSTQESGWMAFKTNFSRRTLYIGSSAPCVA